MMKVFIVEDSEAMRESLRSMMSEFHDVKIVGYAADEAGAIEHINVMLPDVVILDLNLLSGSGVAVLKNIKKHHPEIKVMVLTNCNGELYMDACRRANARLSIGPAMNATAVRAYISISARVVSSAANRISGRAALSRATAAPTDFRSCQRSTALKIWDAGAINNTQ